MPKDASISMQDCHWQLYIYKSIHWCDLILQVGHKCYILIWSFSSVWQCKWVQLVETHEQIVLQSYEPQIGNPWPLFPWTPLILPQDKNKYSVKWPSSEVCTFTLLTSSFTTQLTETNAHKKPGCLVWSLSLNLQQ